VIFIPSVAQNPIRVGDVLSVCLDPQKTWFYLVTSANGASRVRMDYRTDEWFDTTGVDEWIDIDGIDLQCVEGGARKLQLLFKVGETYPNWCIEPWRDAK